MMPSPIVRLTVPPKVLTAWTRRSSTGSRTAFASSGSRSAMISSEPRTSANSTVTYLRSVSSTGGRCRAAAASPAPHPPQNFSSTPLPKPQAGHGPVRRAPHPLQKRLSRRLTQPHCAHSMVGTYRFALATPLQLFCQRRELVEIPCLHHRNINVSRLLQQVQALKHPKVLVRLDGDDHHRIVVAHCDVMRQDLPSQRLLQ